MRINDDEREGWFWIIASALAVTMVAAFYVMATSRPNSTNALPPEESSARLVNSTGDVRQPAAIAGSDRAAPPIATVFECQTRGQRVFSDRRCGSDVEVRMIAAPNRMDAQDTSDLSTPDAVLRRSESEHTYTQVPASDPYRSECSSLEQEKDSIDARMRSAYTSAEGEWFRERLRAIAARYYDLRCKHFH